MFIASAKILVRKDAVWAGPYKNFMQHRTTHHPPTIKAPPKNKH